MYGLLSRMEHLNNISLGGSILGQEMAMLKVMSSYNVIAEVLMDESQPLNCNY